MARRVAKRTIGIQGNSQNTYRRDAISDSQVTRWAIMMKERTTRSCVYSLT